MLTVVKIIIYLLVMGGSGTPRTSLDPPLIVKTPLMINVIVLFDDNIYL